MPISISIIIPIYNVSKHLKECLDTVLNQTFNEMEIIAIDDNSSDNSYEILKEYAAKDSRIIALKNPYNIGAARTRNIGIQLARGKYLAVLDSDDFFELDFLETMFTEAEKSGSDLTLCSFYQYIDSTKKDILYNFLPSFMIKKICNPFDPKVISKELFKIFAGLAVVPFNKLFLRSWLLKNDIYFQDLPNSNDVYFGSAVLIYAKKISYIEKPLIHKRIGWGGNIESRRNKNIYSFYCALKKLYHTLKNTSNFHIYYKSFNAFVIDEIRSVFSNLEKQEQDSFWEFWQKTGFSSLGMLNLNENDFFYVKYYYQWRLMLKKNSIKYDDFVMVNKRIYEKFFDELLFNNSKTAVWGYGLEGKAIVKMAGVCGYNLIEVYDKDKNKHQDGPIPVKFFKNRNKYIDTIIVASTFSAKNIAQIIKSDDKKIRVFDFIAFLEYGISFEDCELF